MREPGMPSAAPASEAAASVGAPAASSPTIASLISDLADLLGAAGVADARREARDLVAAVLDMPRLWPSAHRDELLAPREIAAARAAAGRRASGAPFAYAVGRASFRHLTLDVDERVLIPRQETEMLVEAVLTAMPRAGGTAVEIGTGSGAIALSLAREARFERIIATDVSRAALALARGNAERILGAEGPAVEFRLGSLLAPVRDVRARLLISNPPYIAHEEAPALPPSVRDWEPPVALFSEANGMAATAQLIRGAAALLEPGGLLALEVDSRRASMAAELALADGRYRDVGIRLDLAGRERILLATRTDP